MTLLYEPSSYNRNLKYGNGHKFLGYRPRGKINPDKTVSTELFAELDK
jgi:hypothetical protein